MLMRLSIDCIVLSIHSERNDSKVLQTLLEKSSYVSCVIFCEIACLQVQLPSYEIELILIRIYIRTSSMYGE